MAAVLGDIDGLVFAGGIGENDVATRAEVMEGGSRLGMRADKARNLEPTGRISAATRGSKPGLSRPIRSA